MGMLDRYRKSGGFVQLLNIVETCGPKKQAQFLELIEKESYGWAKAIRKKMLSIERIFSWDDLAVGEVIVRLQELTIGVALHGLTEEQKAKAFATLSHSQKRRIMDVFESKTPSVIEISTSFMKILEEVRSLAAYGHLRLDKIDPELKIEDGIEEKLDSQTAEMEVAPEQIQELEQIVAEIDLGESQEDIQKENSSADSAELDHLKKETLALKREIVYLRQENQKLLREVQVYSDKMLQIHKISEN